MAPKKKKPGKNSAPKKVAEGRKKVDQDSDTESLLHTEFEKLCDSLDNLKKRKEWLIGENESLQTAVDQTRLESQEYISYQSKRHQRLQSLMTKSTERHGGLMDLRRQGEEYQERTTAIVELNKQLLEKEDELVRLNVEICELSEFKTVEQHQLSRLEQLRAEQPSMRLRHRDALRVLEVHSVSERERCEGMARQTLHLAVLAASREVSLSQKSNNEQLQAENKCMAEELQQLIDKARVLRARQAQLQASRHKHLLEREYTAALMRRCDL